MATKKKKKKIVKTREPLDGVEYSRIDGAECPACKMPGGYVTNTLPWEDGLRIRYHVCRRCGSRFKSIEEN
jgi:Zn ribbon nucleic-acid-binding protein